MSLLTTRHNSKLFFHQKLFAFYLTNCGGSWKVAEKSNIARRAQLYWQSSKTSIQKKKIYIYIWLQFIWVNFFWFAGGEIFNFSSCSTNEETLGFSYYFSCYLSSTLHLPATDFYIHLVLSTRFHRVLIVYIFLLLLYIYFCCFCTYFCFC